MLLTATHISYYHVCYRKLWLFINGINMEHTSDSVYDGKLLHTSSYPQRAEKYTEINIAATIFEEIQLTGKIDFYDPKNKIIHEIKRSDKVEDAHEWQVKYYIWLLTLNGILDAHAFLEYPKLRQRSEVWLSEPDKIYLCETIQRILAIQRSEICPSRINSKICRSCSYYDLCFIEET